MSLNSDLLDQCFPYRYQAGLPAQVLADHAAAAASCQSKQYSMQQPLGLCWAGPPHARQLHHGQQLQNSPQQHPASVPCCPREAVTPVECLTAVSAAAAPWVTMNQAQQQAARVAPTASQQMGSSRSVPCWHATAQMQQGLLPPRAQQQLAVQWQPDIQEVVQPPGHVSQVPFVQQPSQQLSHQAAIESHTAIYNYRQPQFESSQLQGGSLRRLVVHPSAAADEPCPAVTIGSSAGSSQHSACNSHTAGIAMTVADDASAATAGCASGHFPCHQLLTDNTAAQTGMFAMVPSSCHVAPVLPSAASDDFSAHTIVSFPGVDDAHAAAASAASGSFLAPAAGCAAQRILGRAATAAAADGVASAALDDLVANSYSLRADLSLDDEPPWSLTSADVLEDLLTFDHEQQQVTPGPDLSLDVNSGLQICPSSVPTVAGMNRALSSTAVLSASATAAVVNPEVSQSAGAHILPVAGAGSHKRLKLTVHTGSVAAEPCAAAAAQHHVAGAMFGGVWTAVNPARVHSRQAPYMALPAGCQSMQHVRAATIAANGVSAAASREPLQMSASAAVGSECVGNVMMRSQSASAAAIPKWPSSSPIISTSLFASLLESHEHSQFIHHRSGTWDANMRLQRQHERRMQRVKRSLASLVPEYRTQ